ncbi:glycoside hydrolase superfamily [Aspergillus carlsbadensis]|nr:glycoside hydrolase superfamily [Aspergillus carlsbadensis]
MSILSNPTQALLASKMATSSQHVVDLSGDKWTLRSPAINSTVPASLPSQVHLDLHRAGLIGNYHGLNELDLRWIAETNWTYTSDPVPGLLSQFESTWLVFEGLDTFATVSFCGHHIASTDNQFRQYAFDVSQTLRECKRDPVISIDFASAPNTVNAIAADHISETWPVNINGLFPNRWFMRKEQSDFGWDWGPAFAPAGPWKPARIVQLQSENIHVLNTDLDIYRKGQINYLPPDQEQPWIVNASLDFIGSLTSSPHLFVEITDIESGELLTRQLSDDVTVTGSSIMGVVDLSDITPELWWPSDLGNQHLYNITIIVDNGSEEIARVTKRTGFRTIFLNQRNITDSQLAQGISPGAHWHFEINGKEFMRKAPISFLLFDAAIAGNQNMLRVWSSDEKGILLWSEFQFSDAMYPVREEFLNNVAEEVVYNVRRVNHHPSLALWAGGNEIESLMLPQAKELDPANYPRYVEEYEKLYISLILPLVPSSTTEGYLSVNLSAPVPMIERYENREAGSYYGDTDYYNYNTAAAFNYTNYPVGRFANEFGFHSMPSLQTWQQALDPADLHFNSSTIIRRNRHYLPQGPDSWDGSVRGMGEMTLAVENYYPVPEKSDPVANFSAWCHATQLFQADFYKSQIQFYRRGSGMPERQLGSLYWQLEDIWQAPTWAGIEYDGRWKAMHYVTRDVYQPVIISTFWDYATGDLEIYVMSDLWESTAGTVTLRWLTLSGDAISNNAGTPSTLLFNVGAINTTRVYSTNIRGLKIPDLKNSILLLSVSSRGQRPNSDEVTTFTHQNYFTPAFPKDLAIVDPKLELSYDDETEIFTVEAKLGVSLYTWLDYPAGLVGYFEENAFVLVPGQRKQIKFITQVDSEDEEWQKKVTVRSIWDQKVRG